MMEVGFRRLGWWWNGNYGTHNRRDVWLEQHIETGVFQLRWRHGQVEDQATNSDHLAIVTALKDMLGEDKGERWLEQVYLDDDGQVRDYMHPDRHLPD